MRITSDDLGKKGRYMKKVKSFKTFVTRAFALFLCFSFLIQQSLLVPVLAAESVFVPDNSHGMGGIVDSNGGVHNIRPGWVNGNGTGFAHFDQFNLSQGEIANLIYQLGGYDKFVNFVNNTVNINGILNTLYANGGFANGHAIFVSPGGVVIGASGVLNVGSLSLITPSQNTYTNFLANIKNNQDLSSLKADSQGNITVDGKIISRGDVEMYGKNITVGSDTTNKNTAGILAGVQNQDVTINALNQAKALFENIVSNNIKEGGGYSLSDGKVVIVAKAVNETKGELTSKADKTDPVSASINVKNATIAGSDVEMRAEASDSVESSIKNVSSALTDAVFDYDKFFNMSDDGAYEDFVGARAHAAINIEDSNIISSGDVNIGTNAIANTKITSTIPATGKALVYALGNETKSEINIKGTEIKAGGDVNATAKSENVSNIKISNKALVTLKKENANAYELMAVNHTTKADTGVNIDGNSKITAKNVNVNAVNSSLSDIKLENVVKFQDEGDKAGSTAGIALLIKNDRINTNASVNGTVKASGDLKVNAQTLHVSDVKLSAKGSKYDPSADKDAVNKDNESHSEQSNGLISKIQGIMNSFSSEKADTNNPTAGANSGSKVELSGVIDLNKSNINTTAEIGNDAKIETGGGVDLKANTVDYTRNKATSESVDGAKFAPGVAVLVNLQNNNTTARIGDGANVKADKDVKVNATTELPLDIASLKLNIKVGDKELVKGGFELSPSSDGSWNFDWLDSSDDSYKGPDMSETEFELAGVGDKAFDYDLLFNNQASASAAGESVGVSGAVVYNGITNNTIASIGDGATVTSTNGNVILNAVNSVVNYNAAGDITKLFGGSAEGGKAGLGGSVLVNNFNNNASATIGNNATVNAVNGEVGLYSVNEAAYLSAISTGSKSDKFALAGSVLVQDITGNTISQIGSSTVNAKTVNVKAGEGKIATVKDKSGLNGNSISMNDERKATDKTSVINIGGALSQQSDSSGNGGQSSSGGAVGATVIVNNTNKKIEAKVLDGATINASDSAAVTADTKYQGLDVAFAGGFAGGVTVNKAEQENANNGTSSNNQSFGNFGGWMDKLSPIINKITGKTQSTDTAVDNASGSSVTGSFADKNVQDSLNSTNDKSQTSQAATNSTTSQGQQLAGSDKLSNTANSSTAANNFSAAAAGAVSVNSNDSTVEASIGDAKINVGNKLDVAAKQENRSLNIATGLSKAGNVGAGAAINVSSKGGSTIAALNGTKVNFTSDGDKTLNVTANEDNKTIDVALGVGAASNSQSGTKAALGGSFNTTVIDNEVKASVNNATIKNAEDKTGNAKVNVAANNYSKGYKGAGGVSYTKGSDTNIGAGIAGNINILDKTTTAEINNSKLSNVSDVDVKANNRGGKTDDIVSFGAGGTVITGGSSSYSFDGAIGVDVIGNTISALINNNSTIDATGAVNVGAYSNIRNSNIAGALQFSTAKGGLGVGLGTIVNVINNTVQAQIVDSTVLNSASVAVNADQIENLKFLAVNMGLTTSGASSAMANAIVNVLNSDIYSYINGGSVNSNGAVSSIANYNSNIEGMTDVFGLALGQGNTLGGNIISNVYTNDTQSKINSTVTAGGKVSAKAQSQETIDIIPIAVAISTGKFGAAANIGANVIVNSTLAEVGGNITSNGLDVIAYDNTDLTSRGGTLAGSTGGAGVGGSIAVDVLNKNVTAKISDGTTVTSTNGKVTVSASASNASGGTKRDDGTYIETDIADIAKILEGTDYDSLKNWQMTYDLAGGKSAGVSGSLITKVVNNNVSASIGNDVTITAAAMDVLANDYVIINAIVGQLAAGGTAAVGGSAFVNVVTGSTTASIGDNTTIKSSGDVNVIATNKEVVRTIMVIGGGAGNVAVNGSANVNTVVNTTKASIGDNVKISGLDENSKAGKVTVKATETVDSQSDNVAISGSGTASVGGVAFVNTFKNNVDATIGKETSTNKTNIKADSLEVNARSEESVGAITVLVSGAGTAGVSGLGIVNVINSHVNASVENAVLDVTNNIDVKASQDYNKTKYGDKAGLYNTLLGLDPGSSKEIDISGFTPIISALNVAGGGTAAVSGSAVVNTITNDVNASIKNSTIENAENVNLLATSDTVTYDAIGNVTGAGTASVSGSAIVNVVDGKTTALMEETTVKKGSVSVKAEDSNTLNGILGGVTAAGNAAVSGYVNENNIKNNTSAKISKSDIQNAKSVYVGAKGINNMAAMSASVGVAGTGANVQGLAILNQNSANTEAIIDKTNITTESLDVVAENQFNLFDLIAAAGVVGTGASVGGNAISNVVDNDLTAAITGSKDNIINVSGNANVNATSTVNMANALASAGISGVGAAIGLAVIANVMDNDILSYIDGVTINGGNWEVSASQTDIMEGGIVGANFGGISVGVNANGTTNIIQDRTKAYIANAVMNDVSSVDVNAKSDTKLDFNALSVAISGLAGVNVSALVNTVKNELYAGIENSSIASNGAVNVSTDQDTNVEAVYATVSGGSVAFGAGSIINILTNTNTAEIKNSGISKSSSITVDAQNKTNVTSDNYSAAGGAAAAGLAVNVNQIENAVKAQIKNETQDITTSGTLKVNAFEDFDLTARAGAGAIGSAGAAGSSNVNIINNAVLAEITSNGKTSVGALDVDAVSDMNLNILTASAAAGLAGMAGSVSVTSIGSKFADSATNEYLVIDGTNAITETQTTANNTMKGNDTIIAGKGYTSGTVELAGTSSKVGTSANVNADITSKGSVDINAENKFEMTKTNAGASIGAGALAANVLVTNMNYNTNATLGGKVDAGTNNVSVTAQNSVTANTNADQASLGGVALGGNVAYFKNDALTTAKIDGATISAGDLKVNAKSTDNITAKAFGATVALASINAVVANSSTTNKTQALVTGDVDITANNMDVKSENTSALKSEMQAYTASGISVSALVNNAVSNSITNAIINASGNINLANDLNVIAATDGISAESTMYLGSLTAIGVNSNTQKSDVSASFNASIDNADLTIANKDNGSANKVTVMSGVKASDNSKAGNVSATVISKEASTGFVTVSDTTQTAVVNVNSTAKVNAKNIKAKNLKLGSNINKTATTGSTSKTLGGVSVSSLNLKSSVGGSTTVTLAGNTEIADTIDVELTETATAHNEIVDAALTIAEASKNEATASVNTNTTVNVGGNIAANNVDVDSNVSRNAYNSMNTKSAGLASLGTYNLLAETLGSSTVNVTANATNEAFNNAFDVSSVTNNTTETYLSDDEDALLAVASGKAENKINATNKINVNGANIKSKGDVKLKAENHNKIAMTKTSNFKGFIGIKGGELKNNITSGVDIEINNADIKAKNVDVKSIVDFGSIGDIKYDDSAGGFATSNGATIRNEVTQNNNIKIKNSKLEADNKLSIAQESNSDFHQEVNSTHKAFVGKNVTYSKLTVNNNNTLDIEGNDTSLTGRYVNISQDSSNNLSSKANTDTHHFGGVNPMAKSYLDLTITNNINSEGQISGGDSVQIDFMKDSNNTLVQYANLYIEAAVATGDADGHLNYTTNNNLNVTSDSVVSSDKDIIVNYSNGNNKLTSDIISKKVSRLLFGIPITVSSRSSKISQGINNSLQLDGEMKAGANYNRYMFIDKDGNIDEKTLEGFAQNEYEIVNGGTIDGDTLTADALNEVKNQIDYINSQIEQLKNDKTSNEEQIAEYKSQINELNNLLNSLNNSISEADVASKMESNISNAIMGSGKIEQDDFNTIWNDTKNMSAADRNNYLNNYVVEPADGDDPAVMLSQEQKNIINNAFNAENNKVVDTVVNGIESSTYEGKLICNDDFKEAYTDQINSTKDSISSALDKLEQVNNGIVDNYGKLEESLASLQEQKDYLTNNKLPDLVVEKDAIKFANLESKPSKIELNGLLASDITGNGKFTVFGSSLHVENYSQKDLIFQNITLNNGLNTGLYISGVDYNTLLDGKDSMVVNDGVTLNKEYGDSKVKDSITINSFFDATNPQLPNSLASNIFFNGIVSNGSGAFNVLNESGDISIKNQINAQSKDIVAALGNVDYDAKGSTLTLNKGDRILAGKNVSINANKIVNNGKVQAGYDNKNLTITDDMLSNLIVDPATGEKNMINLGGNDKSAYLNETNNIKAIYEDGKIILFNTSTEGGNVTFNGTVSGDGEVRYTNGYSEVKITNNTGKTLVVNNLANNRMDGNFTVNGVNKNDTATKQGTDFASTTIKSEGTIDVVGAVQNSKGWKNGDGTGILSISSKNGGINIKNLLNQKGEQIATIDAVGKTDIKNESKGSIEVDGLIQNEGELNITNNAEGGINVNKTGYISNKNGNANITNNKGNLTVAEGGKVISDGTGNINVHNTSTADKLSIAGLIKHLAKGEVNVTNDAAGGLTVESTGVVENTNGAINVTNNKGTLTVAEGGKVVNNTGKTIIKNNGEGGMLIAGNVTNNTGVTNLNNTNAGLTITDKGHVTSNSGVINVTNSGKDGINVQGEIKTNSSNINLTNKDSDIVIGHDNTDKNINSGSNVTINQTNGNVLNYGGDKTLIAANGNLIMNVIDGNIGSTTNANPGFSVNASTRNYNETLNINVKGTVTASAVNDKATDARLINLRSKESDMKVNHIKADGNVMLTAADWDTEDRNPTPGEYDPENYFTGYSIINAATDGKPNIEGQNISVISSNKIGGDKALTYLQRTDVAPDSWVSFEAENDIKLSNVKSDNATRVWQLISKRGSVDFVIGSDAEINEVTSGNHLHLQSLAKNLTIYDLGKTSSFEDPMDDLLYPHDRISLGGTGGVVPQTVAIEVLDIDGGANAESTLKIYNAYVKGANNGQGAYEQYLDQTFQKADVSLMADNIYAHAHDASKSDVNTVLRPEGFNPAEEDSIYNLNDGKGDRYATGFNTVGEGAKLSFDLQGVSKEMVESVNGDSSTRGYNEVEKFQTIEFFNNKYQIPDGSAYMANEVTLSVNSGEGSADTGNNRGLNINKIYANDAYVDTKDLNLSIRDGLINNYAEFRNGNRGGEGNYAGDYRWLTVVDNDFRRLVDSTLQLYTQKTGSFGLDMGNLVILKTKAPAVHYNPYEVANLFRNENSFYRLTYKDDKVQYNTTTLDFKDIDKSTYKATKRVSMRFPAKDQNIQSNVEVYDISKTGALIDNTNNLKIGDKKHVKLVYEDMDIDVDVEVVRITDDGLAGVKFVNMNKSTANKILYLNLSRANSMKEGYTSQLQ